MAKISSTQKGEPSGSFNRKSRAFGGSLDYGKEEVYRSPSMRKILRDLERIVLEAKERLLIDIDILRALFSTTRNMHLFRDNELTNLMETWQLHNNSWEIAKDKKRLNGK